MKIINFVFLVAAIMLVSLPGVFAYALDVKLINQDPSPAQRGEAVDLFFKATVKDSKDPPKSLTFNLQSSYPFTLISSENTEFGNVAGVPSDQPFTFKFRVLIDKDASEGTSKVKVGYSTDSAGAFAYSNYNVSVAETRTDFDVIIQDISENSVSIGIVNSGKNAVSSVVVKIPVQDNFSVTGTNANIIGDLDKGDFTLASFKLVPRSKEEAPLKVEIDYTDSIGNRYTVEKEVLLKIDQSTFISRTRTTSQRGSPSIFDSPLFGAGAAIIIVIIVYAAYKYTKRKKNEVQ